MFTGVEEGTAMVSERNRAEVAPCGTSTLPGTVTTSGLSLLRVTFTPPGPAGLSRVTVPSEGVPITTLVGLSASDVRLLAEAPIDNTRVSEKPTRIDTVFERCINT